MLFMMFKESNAYDIIQARIQSVKGIITDYKRQHEVSVAHINEAFLRIPELATTYEKQASLAENFESFLRDESNQN